jgi:Gluconate 2-dehydrogenase subunit 3
MDRRSALRLLTTAAAIPSLPHSALAAFRSVHASLSDSPALKTLNPHQNAIVCAMADLLIPRTETPGALDARVNEFIDLILTDWFDPPERDRFLAGLAEVDDVSQKHFTNDFVALSAARQYEILTLLGERLLRDLQTPARALRNPGDSAPEPQSFYLTFRRLVLTGYFTSQPGATQQLHYEIIPTKVDFCAPLEPAAPAPKSSQAQK